MYDFPKTKRLNEKLFQLHSAHTAYRDSKRAEDEIRDSNKGALVRIVVPWGTLRGKERLKGAIPTDTGPFAVYYRLRRR